MPISDPLLTFHPVVTVSYTNLYYLILYKITHYSVTYTATVLGHDS